MDEVRRVTLPSGEKRIKRIAYLAEVRNRALRTLQDSAAKFDFLARLSAPLSGTPRPLGTSQHQSERLTPS